MAKRKKADDLKSPPQKRSQASTNPQEAKTPSVHRKRDGAGSFVYAKASFQGPLPPPAILGQYDQIAPGTAERIIALAESETRHRHQLEMSLPENYFRSKRLGQHWGGVITTITLGCGTYLISAGFSAVGLAAVVVAIATPVVAFVTGRVLGPPKLPEASADDDGTTDDRT